jgi:large subunit ribosomal protein L10
LLSRAQKEAQVAELREKFSRATCLYLVDYRGLPVESVNKLRRRVRKEGNGDYEYRVLKNAVLRRAAEGSDYASIAEKFVGPTAIALSFGDPAGLAKILDQFAGENQAFALKGGVVDGSPVTGADIAVLATLPSLDELRGKIVGLLLAPATKLARLVKEPGAGIARVVSARAKQSEAG